MKANSMGFQVIMQISRDGLHYNEAKMQNYENF
jgi:hypothetical protein